MTPSVALPGAAVRVMRTAAGRRALQVVLLVGGLFALGFLCGEQAQAADGAPSTTPTGVVQSAKSAADRVVTAGTSAPEAGTNRSSTVTQVTDTVRHVAQPAADTVVRPIGDVVKTVTDGLGATPPDVLPSVPGFPDLPGLPALPGAGAQAPPVGSAPQPSSGVTERPSVKGEHDKAVRRSDAPADASYGPSGPAFDTGGVAVRRDQGGVRAGQAPARQAPPGDSTGALGNQSAVDNGPPRPGDPHAVTSNHRAPLRLAPGAFAVATAAETRDRYRDIPVFPG
ncbi:hypothetical protein [Streptomyces sp. R41]|uniref:Secreted protein n=1 Tax=Streptomyces sp. R41 TaxID=3238632 RepID=A0AB39RN88_9ACTN